jgi:hypothetical protein
LKAGENANLGLIMANRPDVSLNAIKPGISGTNIDLSEASLLTIIK